MLKLRNLVKVYPGAVTALRGIDLQIDQGMFGLLGPNGAGKSTLMKIVAGLLQPTSGHVQLDDIDVVKRPDLVWQRLGYLPQEFGMYPQLTGEQMLLHLLKLKGVEAPGKTLRQLCSELLERVNLSAAARQKTKGYSGGMLQRLGIAQAIAGDPRLIIVDEPTAGLDPEERLRLYRLLAELSQDRIVLLSTHIVDDVAVLCSRFAMIRGGQLVAHTTPAEARSGLEGKIFEAEVSADDLARLREERSITRDLFVEGRNRVRIFQADGQAPAGFAMVSPTLEDAYLVLTRNADRASGLESPQPVAQVAR